MIKTSGGTRRRPVLVSKVEATRRAALSRAAVAQKLAEAKAKLAAKAEANRKAAEASKAAARKKAEQARLAAEAAAKKVAEAKRLAAQKAAQAKKASAARQAALKKQAEAAKRAADVAAKKASKLKIDANRKQTAAKLAERKQIAATNKAVITVVTAIRKDLDAKIKSLDAKNVLRKRKIKQNLNFNKLKAELRNWKPAIQQLQSIQKRVSSGRNRQEFVDLIRKLVPKKGHRKTELTGKAAKDAVDDFLKRMKIDLTALEKTAGAGTFLLGLGADAAYTVGIEGGAGIAITSGRRELRWYTSVGGTLGLPGPGGSALVQAGWEKGGPEAQKGIYYGIGAGAWKLSVGLSLDINWRSLRDTGISGASVGLGKSFGDGFDANIAVGWGKTDVIFSWPKPQPRHRRIERRPRGRVQLM